MKKVRKIVEKTIILLIMLLFGGAGVFAGELTLSWDQNAETDLAGYKIHYGPNSGNYTNSINVGNNIIYTVDNLTEGQRYYFAVTAYDNSGNESDYSQEVNAVVSVTDNLAPSPPVITNTNVADKRITVAWNNSPESDVAGYKVYYGTTPGNYSNTILVGNATTYTTNTLAEGYTYYFAVTAYDNNNNESGYSAEVHETIQADDVTPPAIPTISSHDIFENKVSLAWGNVNDTDLAGYKVYYGTQSNSYNNVIDVGNVNLYTTPALVPGVTYYFVVTSYDNEGNESQYSSVIVVTIPSPDTTAPIAPTIISYNRVDQKVFLSWKANPELDLANYRLYYGKASRTYDKKIDVGNTTNFTTVNLEAGLTYFFAVTAIDTATNESVYSAEVSVEIPMPDNTPPSVPVIANYIRQDKQVYIAWNNVNDKDLAGYKVHYGFMSRTYDTEIDVNKNTNYLTKELDEGVTYYFAVTSYDSTGNASEYSTEISVTIPTADVTPPSLPLIMSYSRQGNQVSLQWNDNQDDDVSSYKLHIGKSSRNYDTVINVGKTTSYLTPELEYGLTYFFALTALDTANNESQFSGEVSVNIPTPDLLAPAAPSFIYAAHQENRASLIWSSNAEPDFKQYRLYFGKASRSYEKFFDMGKNTSYISNELEEGLTYFFAVTSIDTANNESDYSAEAIITIPVLDKTPPAQPTITDYSRLDKKVMLKWNNGVEADLSGYRLNMGTASRSYNELIDIGLKNDYITRELEYGKTYYFAIAAYDTAGNFSPLSNEIAVTIPTPDVTAPQVPKIMAHERRKYKTYLEWAEVSDPDLSYYTIYYGKSSGSYDETVQNGKSLNYLSPDLDYGVTYYFVVTATDTAGNESDYSGEIKVTIPVPDVTAPSAPIVSDYGLQDAKVYLRWQENSENDVDGYNVYYGLSAGNYTEKKTVGSQTDYITEDLQVGLKYFFVVTAYDTARNESVYSNEISITISIEDKVAPTAPVITSYSHEESKARLEWEKSPEADVAGYRLYYGHSEKNYFESIDVGKSTRYITNELEQGKNYFFAVTAYDTVANESDHSAEVNLYIPVIDKTAPKIPVISQANLEDKRVSLSWLASPDIDLAGYRLYMGNSSRMYGEPVELGLRTSYTTDELVEGLTYYFAITAYDTLNNESEFSNEVDVLIPLPDTEPPSNPVISDYMIRNNKVIINWLENSEEDLAGYKVYKGNSSRNYESSMNVNASTTFTSRELELGVTYYFAVTAYDEVDNESGYSAEVEVMIPLPDIVPPMIPVISSYNLEQNKIHVKWMNNDEVDLGGYNFHYGTESGVYTQKIDVGTNVEYTTPVLERGVKYYFTVSAYDTAGNESDKAKELNIKIPEVVSDNTPPSKPSFTKYYVDGSDAHLEWSNNQEVDLGGYRLYYGTVSGAYDEIEDMGQKNSHTLTDLDQGKKYFFAISAYDTLANESELSNEVSLTIPYTNMDTTPPSIPMIISFNVEQARIRVAWNANSDADIAGYRFYYGSESRNYDVSVDVGNALNYTTRELQRGVKYYFALKAYDSSDNESDYSPEISLKIPDQNIDTTPPQVPAIVSYETIGRQVKLSWEFHDESDLAGFRLYYGKQSLQYDVNVDVGNSTSYITRELEQGLTYYFSLVSYDDSNNESEFSNEVEVTIPETIIDVTAPNVPEISSATVNERKVHLVWNEILDSDLAGYKVYYGTESESYDVVVNIGLNTEYVSDNLSEGMVYYFVVTAYDTLGNESDFSNEAAAEIAIMDIVPPTIYAVEIQDSVTVNLIYSEIVEKSSAEKAANYAINNGIQIFKVNLDKNGRLVSLITSEHKKDIEYIITVNNVTDIAKNPNLVKPNSQASYRYNPEDNKSPYILDVIAIDETHIDVTFSEDIERKSAETIKNYKITNGIEIFSASLDGNLRTVSLVTSVHINNVNYVLTIDNVTDRAPVPNAIAPNTQFSYTYVERDTEPPRLYSAEIRAKDKVVVTFNEIIDEESAENINNYKIDNNIVINAVDLQTNLRQVELKTSPHQIDENYNLKVSNVVDRARPGNLIDPDYNHYRYHYAPQDNQPPKIDLAEAKDGTHVALTFNEEVDRESAEKVSNYSVDNGIGVISAILDQTYRVVILTTTEHESGETYQVTVKNVVDRAPSPNVIASNTMRKYTYSISDVTPPKVDDIIVVNATTINVMFNEIVDRVTAENRTNYSINKNVEVYKAFLNEDLKTVSLSTSEHSVGDTYELMVQNIKDRAFTANSMNQSQRVDYKYRLVSAGGDVVVGNFNIKSYRFAYLNEKDQYYIDRSYVIEKLPNGYNNLLWIMTANDDRYVTDNAFFSFDLNKDATVYIAFDSNAKSRPDWLKSEYKLTGASVEVSGYSEKMEIWERHFDKGRVTIGGNSAVGAKRVESMYSIIIRVDKDELDGSNGKDERREKTDGTDNVKLYQNYPNPFNAGTEIRFQIPENSFVTLTVYNILGQTVRHLADGERQASEYVLHWDGRNGEGNVLPSGVYFLRLEVIRRTMENGKQINKVLYNNVRKMLFLK